MRELAILYALWVLPGLLTVDSAAVIRMNTIAALVRTIVHNVSFGLLIVYLLDLQDLRKYVLTPPISPASGWKPTTFGLQSMAVLVTLLVLAWVAAILAGNRAPPRASFATGTGAIWWAAALLTMLTVGALEELFFRCYLLFRLTQMGASLPAAVVVAAAMFSLGHVYQGLPAVAFSGVVGIILSLYWLKGGFRYEALAVGHGLYNALALLISAA